jgi:hypothetical protein
MKRIRIHLLFATLAAAAAVLLLVRHPRSSNPAAPSSISNLALPIPPVQSSGTAVVSNVSTAPSSIVSKVAMVPSNFPGGPTAAAERLQKLEWLGRVPDDADLWDWWLAQKTSWWGKRIDTKAFWKGRVVWLDSSASLAAQRRGRFYPPIPYAEPGLASRSGIDRTTLPAADTPGVLFRYNDQEMAFWDGFTKTHPPPAETIATLQLQFANQILGSRYNFEHGDASPQMTQARLEQISKTLRAQMEAMGCPPEATTHEALQWAMVLNNRAEYEQQYVRTHRENTLSSSNFLAGLLVDAKLVTQPLTGEQLRAAKSWKMAYLRRLRRDKADNSYVSAYLQAWNLSAAEVFGGTNGL